ncbi:UNVERIFIED_ORG: GNAT superfamily N-acetyltransferase [Sphingomonas sp. R1F5B]
MATGRLTAPVPLADDHEVDEFDCGEPALNAWLQQRARRNEGRFARTYVVCDDRRVAAYVCILAGAVERREAPSRLRRNAPDLIPVSIIGRLAVNRRHAGQGLGSDLLADALRRIALAAQSIGIGAVMVHAKNEQARRFYLKCAEFLEYPADSRTLFLPIETLIAALP